MLGIVSPHINSPDFTQYYSMIIFFDEYITDYVKLFYIHGNIYMIGAGLKSYYGDNSQWNRIFLIDTYIDG